MAFRNQCVRCGREEHEHSSYLFEEEPVDAYAWIDEIEEGFSMDVLRCMEKPFPKSYSKKVEKLYWGTRHWRDRKNHRGYMSPNPKEEDAFYSREVNKPLYLPHTVYVLYFKNGRSVVAIGE